jgi:hypothetical protein
MSTSQHIQQIRELEMRGVPHASPRLEKHLLRALNKIKKPNTAEEITDLLNRDLGPGDGPFETKEVANWLKSAHDAKSLSAGKPPAQIVSLLIAVFHLT